MQNNYFRFRGEQLESYVCGLVSSLGEYKKRVAQVYFIESWKSGIKGTGEGMGDGMECRWFCQDGAWVIASAG